MKIDVILDPDDETKAMSGHYAHLWKSSQTPEAKSLASVQELVKQQQAEIEHLKKRLRFAEIQSRREVRGEVVTGITSRARRGQGCRVRGLWWGWMQG